MSPAPSSTRRVAPSTVHLAANLIAKLLDSPPGQPEPTVGRAGMLFGRVEQDAVSIVAFQRFPEQLPKGNALPETASGGSTVFALGTGARTDVESTSLGPIGWFRVRNQGQSDLGPEDLAFHNRHFRRASDIVLFVTRAERERGTALDLFAKSSSKALSATSYASSSLILPADLSLLGPLTLPLRASVNNEWCLGVYQALNALNQDSRQATKRRTLLKPRWLRAAAGSASLFFFLSLAVAAAVIGWAYWPRAVRSSPEKAAIASAATIRHTAATVRDPVVPAPERPQVIPSVKPSDPVTQTLPTPAPEAVVATPQAPARFVLPSFPVRESAVRDRPHVFQPARAPDIPANAGGKALVFPERTSEAPPPFVAAPSIVAGPPITDPQPRVSAYLPPRPLKQVMPNTRAFGFPMIRVPTVMQVDLTIDDTGHVSAAHVRESKSESGGLLEAATLRAAKQWVFEPAKLHGKPIPSEHIIEFRLNPAAGTR